jgi:hypothetical protein
LEGLASKQEKLPCFPYDVTIYVENTKISTETLLNLTENIFRKVAGLIMNIKSTINFNTASKKEEK